MKGKKTAELFLHPKFTRGFRQVEVFKWKKHNKKVTQTTREERIFSTSSATCIILKDRKGMEKRLNLELEDG